jgi:hypothetical protein
VILDYWSSCQDMTHRLPTLLLFWDTPLAVRCDEMLCFHELCNIARVKLCRALYRTPRGQLKREPTCLETA